MYLSGDEDGDRLGQHSSGARLAWTQDRRGWINELNGKSKTSMQA
jgi:hypothetical protein